MANTQRYLAVKNFERFQHYKDRNPTWIKLYNSLLDDYAFTQLSEVARCHLLLIWLLASRHENKIPYDAKFISRAVHAKARVNLEELIATGFLIEVVQVGTDALAQPEQNGTDSGHAATPRVRPRARGETEVETETENGNGSGARRKNASGEAALILASIRKLAEEQQSPAAGTIRFIRRERVVEMGPEIAAAYDAVGGSERVLTAAGKDHSFLARDFANALEAARA